jgi:hypothetical protein
MAGRKDYTAPTELIIFATTNYKYYAPTVLEQKPAGQPADKGTNSALEILLLMNHKNCGLLKC